MHAAGIVLCGGESRRMGQSKATLPFGEELMLPRVLRLLGEVVAVRSVVAAPEQPLPPLPPDVSVTRDRRPGHGPLEGLYCGLAAVRDVADAAYVTGCDVPLLEPAFVRRLIDLLETHDVVVPVEGRFHHPLAAVYRPAVADVIRDMLDHDQRRLICFFDHVSTRRVEVDQLRDVDPDLRSLMNLNHPDDYRRALEWAERRRLPDRP
jgi:molybdenum cofactor guanylyltransferase